LQTIFNKLKFADSDATCCIFVKQDTRKGRHMQGATKTIFYKNGHISKNVANLIAQLM